MPDELTGVRLDAQALRVLAHPLRARLLSRLRLDGPATATSLAADLTTNTGATSYHLRKLESVGLVSDTGEGAGKERLWKASTDFHSYHPIDFEGDEDAQTSLTWLQRHYAHHVAGQVDQWLDASEAWPIEWREAATASDRAVLVTAEQLERLNAELMEVIDRYRLAGEGDPRARRVTLYTLSYPLDLDQPPGS